MSIRRIVALVALTCLLAFAAIAGAPSQPIHVPLLVTIEMQGMPPSSAVDQPGSVLRYMGGVSCRPDYGSADWASQNALVLAKRPPIVSIDFGRYMLAGLKNSPEHPHAYATDDELMGDHHRGVSAYDRKYQWEPYPPRCEFDALRYYVAAWNTANYHPTVYIDFEGELQLDPTNPLVARILADPSCRARIDGELPGAPLPSVRDWARYVFSFASVSLGKALRDAGFAGPFFVNMISCPQRAAFDGNGIWLADCRLQPGQLSAIGYAGPGSLQTARCVNAILAHDHPESTTLHLRTADSDDELEARMEYAQGPVIIFGGPPDVVRLPAIAAVVVRINGRRGF